MVNSSLFQKILLPPPVGSKQANPFFLDYLNSEEGSKILQNINNHLPIDTSWYLRRLESSFMIV